MYRYNKANLWLRTICVTVVLLGMLFFTQSQLSVAAPTAVSVEFSTADTLTTVNLGGTVTVKANATVDSSKTLGAVKLFYSIGSTAAVATLATESDASADVSGTITVAAADSGVLTFNALEVVVDSDAAANYTTDGTPAVTVTFDPKVISVDGSNTIGDPTTLDLNITAEKTVGAGDEVAFAAKIVNDTTANALVTVLNATVNYKVGDDKAAIVLEKGNDSVWAKTLTIAADAKNGSLTFESIALDLTDGTTNITRTYGAEIAGVGDLNITVEITAAAANETTSAASSASSSASETTSDSPLSFVALFVLLTSVSVAIGVYTLKRKR